MRILPEFEIKIRREIRDARAKDPLVSVVSIQEQLAKKFEQTFSRKYLAKLAHKVAREGLIEADRTKLEERMQFTRENYRMMRERLLKIIYWKPEDGGKPPMNKDVNEAAKNIVMMDLAILQAEAAAGMYRKPIEALAKEIHYEPVPVEVRTVIIAAWQRGDCCRCRRLRRWFLRRRSRLCRHVNRLRKEQHYRERYARNDKRSNRRIEAAPHKFPPALPKLSSALGV
jgi:hypothetical protein